MMTTKGAKRAALAGTMIGLAGAAAAQTPPQAVPPAPAAPASVSLPTPGMAGPLGFQSVPWSLDTGPLGKWYVDGVL